MKDKLGRDIHQGYKLAFVQYDYAARGDVLPLMQIAKVSGVADFALHLTLEDESTRVISNAADYVIVSI